jgi:hypothetical protein
MDEENIVNEVEQEQKPEQSTDTARELEALRRKNHELLDEAKRAKSARREAEERAEREAQEKARKDGDFEQLLKSSEGEREKLHRELETLRGSIAKEKVGNTALALAGEIADGVNAELLSEFISRRLKYTDQGVKVLDENGELTISSIAELKLEFEQSERYKALLRGSKSNGGGATGSRGSAVVTKKFNEHTSAELVEIKRNDPQLYERLREESIRN